MRHALFGLLVLSSWAFAAPPELKINPEVPDDQPIIIKACTPTFLTIKTTAKSIIWDAPPSVLFTPQDKLASKVEPQITVNTVGDYVIVAVGIAGDEGTKVKRKITVVPWTPEPSPTPIPVPPVPPIEPPLPPPQPVGKGQLFAYFVEQTTDAVEIRGAMFSEGQALRKFQDAGKHFVAALPINTNDPNYTRYAQLANAWKAKGNRLPYLAIFTKVEGQAKLLWEGTTPDAPGKVLELFQKYGK